MNQARSPGSALSFGGRVIYIPSQQSKIDKLIGRVRRAGQLVRRSANSLGTRRPG